jgi:hypothetical protein
VENSLDAILEATRQVPRDQWASAKYALEDAIDAEITAHCEAVLDDQTGVCACVGDTLLFVRYDERGLAVTLLGSLRGGTLTETTQSRQGTSAVADEFNVRLLYEHLARRLSIQTTRSELEHVRPIRELLRRWSSDPG